MNSPIAYKLQGNTDFNRKKKPSKKIVMQMLDLLSQECTKYDATFHVEKGEACFSPSTDLVTGNTFFVKSPNMYVPGNLC